MLSSYCRRNKPTIIIIKATTKTVVLSYQVAQAFIHSNGSIRPPTGLGAYPIKSRQASKQAADRNARARGPRDDF